jgi:hypothetical protein
MLDQLLLVVGLVHSKRRLWSYGRWEHASSFVCTVYSAYSNENLSRLIVNSRFLKSGCHLTSKGSSCVVVGGYPSMLTLGFKHDQKVRGNLHKITKSTLAADGPGSAIIRYLSITIGHQ